MELLISPLIVKGAKLLLLLDYISVKHIMTQWFRRVKRIYLSVVIRSDGSSIWLHWDIHI